MSGYLRDIALRKQLEEKVKEATHVRKEAESELEAARKAIDDANAVDADVSRAEESLTEAGTAAEARDYKVALEKATESHARARRAFEERVRDIVKEAGKLIQLAQTLGLDIADAPTILKGAGEALTQDGFGEAADLARKAWKRAEKTLHEHLAESFSKAQSLILTAKKIGKDTGPLANLIEQARSAMDANDFEGALSFTRECLESVTEDLQEDYESVLTETEDIVGTAREMGADPAKADSLIERARHDASAGEFEKALNALKLSRTETERAMTRNLEGSTAKFARLLEEAERIGASIGTARERFEASERAIKGSRFAEGAVAAREGLKLLQKAQFERLAFVMSQSRDKFMMAMNLGADVAVPKELMNRARIAAQKGMFDEALSSVREADTALERYVSKYRDAETRVRELYSAIAEGETLGVKAAKARTALDAARSSFQEKDVEKTADLLRRAEELLERAEYERTMEVVEDAESVLSSGEPIGGDLSEASRSLEEAMLATKEKSYRRAIDLATRAKSAAEGTIQRKLQLGLDGLRESLGFLGEGADAVRSLSSKAETALAARDTDSAYGFLEQARKLAEGQTRGRAGELEETLRLATSLGTDLGSDVTDLEALLREATAAVSDGRHTDILGMADRVSKAVGAGSEAHFQLLKRRALEVKDIPEVFDQVREHLKRAKIALGVEDYAGAYRLMRECNDAASHASDRYRRTHDAISSAAALVAEARKRDVDVSKVLEMLLEAKKAFERHDYEKALDWANRSKADTDRLMVLYGSAKEILASREKLDLAAKLGLEAPHVREMLDRAKESMKSKEYPMALTLAERAETEISDLVRDKVSSILTTAEGLMETMEAVELAEVQHKIAKAREYLDAAELPPAVSLALEAQDDVEGLLTLGQEADLAIQKARDLIAEVEAMNLEAPSSNKLLQEAERHYKAGIFTDALALATKATSELEREQEENVGRMMKTFEEAITKAREEGVDTRIADRRLEKARELLDAHQYRQALSLAMQAEGEAERVGLQQEMASKAVQTAEKKQTAFGRPLASVERMVAEAKEAFDAGDYVKALDLAIQSGDEFNRVRELTDGATEVRYRVENLLKVTRRINAPTDEIEKLFSKGEAALESGKSEDAAVVFQEAMESGLRLCRSHLEDLRTRAREYAAACARLGLETPSTLKGLSEAQAHLETENFESAFLLIQRSADQAKDALTQKVLGVIAEARDTLDHARKIGAEVGDGDELIKEAEEDLASGEFEQALRLVEAGRSRVEGRRQVDRRFVDLTFKAETTIKNARKYGLDVKDAESVLQKAIRTRTVDMAQAILQAEEAYRIGWEALEAFAPDLDARLEVGEAILGEEVEATLILTNGGKALAKDVSVKILGDAEVEGLRSVPAIRAKGSEKIELRIKMSALGEVPLAMQITSHRIIDDREYVRETIATVLVSEAVAAVEKKPTLADSAHRCPVCKGKIKKGYTIATCQCGRNFHEACAARVGRCPACFRNLKGRHGSTKTPA